MKKIIKKGFTLIELLVVIAIIGILASVVLISVNSARKKARDARRIADIKQIYNALQMYYDNNGQYPNETYCDSSVGSCGVACPCSPLGAGWSATSIIHGALVGGEYLSEIPIDPLNNATYFYDYEPDCNQGDCAGTGECCYFRLRARLEQGSTYTLEGH